jgi:hypothetical protein
MTFVLISLSFDALYGVMIGNVSAFLKSNETRLRQSHRLAASQRINPPYLPEKLVIVEILLKILL